MSIITRSLPRITNDQFDYIQRQARQRFINLNECPTCGNPRQEVAPNTGLYYWGRDFTYRYNGEDCPCNCELQSELQRQYLLADIPKDYWRLGVDDFWGDSDALEKTLEYIERFDSYRKHGMGLQFYSPTQGVGKTFLASIVAKSLIRKRIHVKFMNFRDLTSMHHLDSQRFLEATATVRNCPVLVLDEIGVAMSDAQNSLFAMALEDLLRSRTSGQGVTILTTNLKPRDLEYEYPRCFSLLASKEIEIEVKGEDVRRNGTKAVIDLELEKNGEQRPIV